MLDEKEKKEEKWIGITLLLALISIIYFFILNLGVW